MSRQDTQKLRAAIDAAPFPMTGPPIHKRTGVSLEEGYELAVHALARALLLTCEERPELLDCKAEQERDPSGFEAASNEKLWAAAKEKWPELNAWLGGATGFQFGWAHNAVRALLGVDAVGNPAIVTLTERGAAK